MVFGQSSSARDQSGVATSSVDFLTTATISYDVELEVRLIIFIDGFTFVIKPFISPAGGWAGCASRLGG